MNKLRFYILPIYCVMFLTGCLTLNQFNKAMSTPNITPKIARDTMGKPNNEEIFNVEGVDFHIMHYQIPGMISDNDSVAIFVNNKYFLSGLDNDYTLLEFMHKAKLIDEDEYRWKYQMLQQQEIARQQAFWQMYSAAQNASYQQQSLQNQRALIQSVNQPVYTYGTIQRVGDTYQYQGTSQPLILPSK